MLSTMNQNYLELSVKDLTVYCSWAFLRHCSHCPLSMQWLPQKELEVLGTVGEIIGVGYSWLQEIAIANLCLDSASCKETRGSHLTPEACSWLAWGRRNNRGVFWARGEGHDCCFMGVTLRAITVNSKLARVVGRKTGTLTSMMLVKKLPPWQWPQRGQDSGYTWNAEFTHWGGPGFLGVPRSCPPCLGSSWGCRMFYWKWESPHNLLDLCLQVPKHSCRSWVIYSLACHRATLPHRWPVCAH